jgi:hypothetical protein
MDTADDLAVITDLRRLTEPIGWFPRTIHRLLNPDGARI